MTARVTPGWSWVLRARWPDGASRPPLQVADAGCLDELVVDDWLHLEQMTERAYCLIVGDVRLWVEIPRDGRPVVTVERDTREVRKETT